MNTYNNSYLSGKRPAISTKQEAIEVLSEFFYTFHLVEVQEGLRNLLNTAVKNNICMSQTEKEDLSYFCKKLEELTEAAYILKE